MILLYEFYCSCYYESLLITGRNEVLAKVIFSHLSVILFTGGAGWRTPPPPAGWRTPPRMEEPPRAGWRTPPPPRAGWRTPPRLDGEPPRMEEPPPGWMENPPPLPREADSGIRSTIILLECILVFIIFCFIYHSMVD